MGVIEQLLQDARQYFDDHEVSPYDSAAAVDAERAWCYAIHDMLSSKLGAEADNAQTLGERERLALELFGEIIADTGLKNSIAWWVSNAGARDFPTFAAFALDHCEPLIERLQASIEGYDKIMDSRCAAAASNAALIGG
jgi:hypothetical protein